LSLITAYPYAFKTVLFWNAYSKHSKILVFEHIENQLLFYITDNLAINLISAYNWFEFFPVIPTELKARLQGGLLVFNGVCLHSAITMFTVYILYSDSTGAFSVTVPVTIPRLLVFWANVSFEKKIRAIESKQNPLLILRELSDGLPTKKLPLFNPYRLLQLQLFF
jgi:hypothetical protein